MRTMSQYCRYRSRRPNSHHGHMQVSSLAQDLHSPLRPLLDNRALLCTKYGSIPFLITERFSTRVIEASPELTTQEKTRQQKGQNLLLRSSGSPHTHQISGQSLLSIGIFFLPFLMKDLIDDLSLFSHWVLGTFRICRLNLNNLQNDVVRVFIEARRLTMNCIDSG